MRKPAKHPQIFQLFDSLAVGESFLLINDHNPRHLRDEFETDHFGEYDWQHVERGPEQWQIKITRRASTPTPQILCNTQDVASEPCAADGAGAVWKLQMERRHLDSNIVHLPPRSRIDPHAGPDLDVLVHVLHGDGRLTSEVETLELRPGALLWLPRLSRREIVAGEVGLTYLTVHPRRPGLTIQPAAARRECGPSTRLTHAGP
ncbi:MAG TPA: DUF2249 domain-containing protein, partial [Microlunatus sp.]|nr:DUF2249 domain-containing protein [Microlunatus sp.]